MIVHVLTDKGRGYSPAEQDDADRFHAVGKIHPETGLPIEPSRFGWTSVFADEMVTVGAERDDIVAITAAMLEPVGLGPFAREYPDRVIDVGIAEQHAVTSAAGLAFAGMHPVVAVYATFLNRAFDQVLMDVALHRAGVTFMLDRAGITGDDGASHNGMWDMALLRHVPGLRIAAPRDEADACVPLSERRSILPTRPPLCGTRRAPSALPIPAIAAERAGSTSLRSTALAATLWCLGSDRWRQPRLRWRASSRRRASMCLPRPQRGCTQFPRASQS